MSELEPVDLAKEAASGAEADRLLREPAWVRAKAHTELELLRQLKSIGVKDKDGQHDLVRCLQLLDTLTRFIEQEADTGKLARIQVSQPTILRRLFG